MPVLDEHEGTEVKFLRVGAAGEERPAAQLSGGHVVDISPLIDDITPDLLGTNLSGLLAKVTANRQQLPALDLAGMRVGPPLRGIGKIVCVGLNYRKHAEEAGQPVPQEPVLFLKAPDTVGGAYDPVLIPPSSTHTDYEVELAVIIGRTARYLTSRDDPLDWVAGYAISNDVSEREYQLERGGQWDKGKNCETFNPLGPWFVTTDEIPNPQRLTLDLCVNGEVRQHASTTDMIFTVEFLVAYISQFMVLRPGDVINTGTPSGVGSGFSPPRFLNDGDVVELAIDGLGKQRQVLRRARRGADSELR